MILNNYYKYLAAVGDTSNSINTDIIRYPGIKNVAGSTFGITVGSNYFSSRVNQMNINLNVRKNTFVRVGTGTTEVTKEDYNLANDVTTSFSSIQNTQTISTDENGKLVITYIFSGVNNSGNSITIIEAGIYKSSIWGATNETGLTNNAFFARKVLDEPITVPNGTTLTLTFQWEEG